jgi:hypothetical protein
MHVERRFVTWGLFFIAVGAVPLAVRAGAVPAGIRWWELWPLLLVGWGIGLVLGRTGAGVLGGGLVALTLGAIVGGVLTAGSGFAGFGTACDGAGTGFASQTGTFGAATASVRLEPGCGTLDVATGSDGWRVEGATPDGGVPEIDTSGDSLTVRAQDRGFVPFGVSGGSHWTVTLPAGQAMDLAVTANAGTARLDLAGGNVTSASLTVNAGSVTAVLPASLTSFSVTANAGSASLTLPSANVSGTITANAGSVALCVPPGTAIRIRLSDAVLGGNNFANHGLAQSGDTWTSPDYGSAPTRIDVSATANVGSVNLDPEGGCR